MKVELIAPIEQMIREVVDASLKAAGANAYNHAMHIFSWLDAAHAQEKQEVDKFKPVPLVSAQPQAVPVADK